jgi:choline dehydrogenase-like flavoprotein
MRHESHPMIIDFEQADVPDQFDGDLCIIGAGAAGISIAAELANSGHRILLIESGGFEFEGATQGLYDTEDSGIARQPMIMQRLRMFGGSTNHWDGRCAPLDPIDFEQRDWIPYSGWPMTRADLDPFYVRAHAVCDLRTTLQNSGAADLCQLPSSPADPDKLVLHSWQFSPPTRFGKKFRGPLAQSASVTVILHANVINIATDEDDSHATHIDIATLQGRKGKVRASLFVLACGAIENPRLLLASSRRRQAGVGNTHDLIGRFFMEHLRTKFVAVPLGDSYPLRTVFSECENSQGKFLFGSRLADGLQRDRRIGNLGITSYTEGGEESATNAAFRIAKDLSSGTVPDNFSSEVLYVLRDLDSLIVNARRRALIPDAETIDNALVVLACEAEQVPNPNSRISLSTRTDALGVPQARVDWQLHDIDLHTTQVAASVLSAQLAAHFGTRIRLPDWLLAPLSNWQAQFRDVAHHIGTTRMANDAAQGVVNKDCRMHAIDNLYVAGRSVCPTGGHANPTLTIVALALRLADHLKSRLAGAA